MASPRSGELRSLLPGSSKANATGGGGSRSIFQELVEDRSVGKKASGSRAIVRLKSFLATAAAAQSFEYRIEHSLFFASRNHRAATPLIDYVNRNYVNKTQGSRARRQSRCCIGASLLVALLGRSAGKQISDVAEASAQLDDSCGIFLAPLERKNSAESGR